MEYKELLKKYNILLNEVDRLSKENISLKEKLGIDEPATSNNNYADSSHQIHQNCVKIIDDTTTTSINNHSCESASNIAPPWQDPSSI